MYFFGDNLDKKKPKTTIVYLSFGPFSATLSDLKTTTVHTGIPCTRSNGTSQRELATYLAKSAKKFKALTFTGVLLKVQE